MALSEYLFSGKRLERGSVDDDGHTRYLHLTQNVPDGFVHDLQVDLVKLGFDEAGTPDGAFGDSTRNAVLAFQEAASLERTGVVEGTTRARIATWLHGGHTRDNPPPPPEDTHEPGDNKFIKPRVTHFSQGDPAWADRVLGRNRPIRKSGCAITCIAMILRHYGRPVDPAVLDEFLDANDGYAGDNVKWLVAAKCGKGRRKKLVYGRCGADDDVAGILKKRLDAGKPTMVRVDYKDDVNITYNHFVLAVGRTPDGEIIINDPATRRGDGYADPTKENIIEQTSRHGGYVTVRLDWYDKA